MTTPTPLHPAPLSELLTVEERAILSEELQQKLNQSVNEVEKSFHSKMQLQLKKVTNDHHTFNTDLNRKQRGISALEREQKKYLDLEKNQEIQFDLNSKLRQQATTTNIELEQKLKSVEGNNTMLLKLLEKRNAEISGMDLYIQKLTKELESTIMAKIEVLQKEDEFASKEIEIKYRENILLLPETYKNEQIKLLTEEMGRMSLDPLKSELESLRNQLELTKANVSEYKTLSNVLEKQFTTANQTNQGVNNEFEQKIVKKEATLITTLMDLENLESYKNEAVELVQKTNENCNTLYGKKKIPKLRLRHKFSFCLHSRSYRCGENPNTFLCIQAVEKKMYCGHSKFTACHKKLNPAVDCTKVRILKQACGHFKNVKCRDMVHETGWCPECEHLRPSSVDKDDEDDENKYEPYSKINNFK